MSTDSPSTTDRLAEDDMRREIVLREINQGALAGMSSEITGQAADLVLSALNAYDAWKAQQQSGGDIASAKAALRPPYMLALANLVTDAQTNHPHGGESPAIVHGCVIYDAKHLREAVRTVWTTVPALLDELETKRAEIERLQARLDTAEGRLAKSRERHKPTEVFLEWHEFPVQSSKRTVCSGCSDFEAAQYQLWPCPEAVALGLGEEPSDV